MNSTFNIWETLSGIAFFMIGMSFLENGLRELAGRPFKLFLKKQTSNKIKGIAGGAVVTAVLQSSSVVNLMILAFAGASVISMQNALAVILGANAGTTVSSWIIATIGFSVNIQAFAYPITAIAGIGFVLLRKDTKWYNRSMLLLGFGLLFIGLDYIKGGIEDIVKQADLSALSQYPLIVFLLAGFIIASLIQSSSATLAIALSALHANAIELPAAMAIALGSETGTAIKLVIAAAGGMAIKKRVAWGNMIFNIITSLFMLVLLKPTLLLITEILQVHNTLIALVLFQSLTNIVSIIIFYPLLKPLSLFLERRFNGNNDETYFLHKTGTADADLAMDAMKNEAKYFFYSVTGFCTEAFAVEQVNWQQPLHTKYKSKPFLEKYEQLKITHGHIHNHYTMLLGNKTNAGYISQCEQVMTAVRNCMYAAKSTKDAYYDTVQLRNSSNDIKYDYFITAQKKILDFYTEVIRILNGGEQKEHFEDMVRLYNTTQAGYNNSINELYQKEIQDHLSDTEISTLINFNRELYSSFKAIIFALKDYQLTEKEAAYFDELPGFIR